MSGFRMRALSRDNEVIWSRRRDSAAELCVVGDCLFPAIIFRRNFGGREDVFMHVRQPPRRAIAVSLSLLVLVFVTACEQAVVQPSTSTSNTSPPTSSTTTTDPSTTTVPLPRTSGAVDLVRVDPATLEPVPGSAAITSGDWISGTMSENGEWLVLNVWIDTEPDTDLIQVVEVASGSVVTEIQGPLMHELQVGNDGSVFHQSDPASGVRLSRLAPGGTEFEVVVDAPLPAFSRWGSFAFLDDDTVGWLGLAVDSDKPEAALLVADISDGSAQMFSLPGVTMGQVGEKQLGDWTAPEIVEPAVLWDSDRNRAIVVHADEPVVTVVDLGTGDIAQHTWAASTSWIDALLAWLIPPAHAKGPSFGTTRSAALSPSGEFLYIAAERADVAADGSEVVHIVPQGVEVISTDDWTLVAEFDIPASRVALSPDGGHLVATGISGLDTAISSSSELTGVYIINTETLEMLESPEFPSEWIPDIQFSDDSQYLYLGASGGGRVSIVELETAESLGEVTGSERTTMFGPAGMLSAPPTR